MPMDHWMLTFCRKIQLVTPCTVFITVVPCNCLLDIRRDGIFDMLRHHLHPYSLSAIPMHSYLLPAIPMHIVLIIGPLSQNSSLFIMLA